MSLVEQKFQRRFLDSLQDLERFRMMYLGLNPDLPLSSGDQDVQRLIEAQAFFSARTADAAERAMTRSMQRLFAQHFPYFVSPVAASAMIEARHDGRFADPTFLPEGERLAIDGGGSREVVFRTCRDLLLSPIDLVDVQTASGRSGDAELFLTFKTAHARRGPVGRISLFVDNAGEFVASAYIFHLLEDIVRSAEVYFEGLYLAGQQRRRRSRCRICFGPPPGTRRGGRVVDHPLAVARAFFRLPEQGLFLTIDVPDSAEEWTSFTIVFQLSRKWERGLRISPDNLRLHVVPAVNLFQDMSSPLSFDGLKSRQLVSHAELADARPHSVQGVYRIDSEAGLTPLPPGFVPPPNKPKGTRWAWEVDFVGDGLNKHAQLHIATPETFENPMRATVEAFWHEPALTANIENEANIYLRDRVLEGVRFAVKGRVLPPLESVLEENEEALLELLAARSQRFLDLQSLRRILEILFGPRDRVFDKILGSLVRVEIVTVPSYRSRGGVRFDYVVEFAGLDVRDLPVLHVMCGGLYPVLRAWNTDDIVGLSVELPELDRRFEYRGQESWR